MSISAQFRQWLVRGPLAIVLLSALSARAEQPAVLVLTQMDLPAVHQVVEALKNRRAVDGRPLPSLVADVHVTGPGLIERPVARELRPVLKRYQAVYATTMYLARALQMEDSQIPIIFEGAADPLQLCLVNSLSRPGRNATGYMNQLPDEDDKLMEVLVDGFPTLKRIFYLVAGNNLNPLSCDPSDMAWEAEAPPCRSGLRAIDDDLRRLVSAPAVKAQAQARGVELSFVVICGAKDIARLPSWIQNSPDIGFVAPWQLLFRENAQELVDTMARLRRPVIYGRWMFGRLGGTLALEPILDATDDKAPIDMLLQVLEGRSPATMPVQMPRGFRIMVNAAAAAKQGLQPSLSLLRRADDIVLK